MYRYHLLMITLTDTAAVKVKQLLEAEGATELALRVAVRPGGCSGFSYEMYFDGDVASDDQTLTRLQHSFLKAQASTTKMACKMQASQSTTQMPAAPAVVETALANSVQPQCFKHFAAIKNCI
jgi:iron-sulfur cluster assembly accessory protein